MKALKGRKNVGGYASKFRLLCRRVVRRRERLFVTTSSHLGEFCRPFRAWKSFGRRAALTGFACLGLFSFGLPALPSQPTAAWLRPIRFRPRSRPRPQRLWRCFHFRTRTQG